MARRDSQTADMFVVPQAAEPVPASMDYRRSVSELIGQILELADCDRHEVSARVSRLVGKPVSKYMLDAYSAGGREDYNIPAYLIPAIETACDTHAYTNWLVGNRGGVLLIGREAYSAELGREQRKLEATRKRIRDIKRALGDDTEIADA